MHPRASEHPARERFIISRTAGSTASARAIWRRWRIPPESCEGNFVRCVEVDHGQVFVDGCGQFSFGTCAHAGRSGRSLRPETTEQRRAGILKNIARRAPRADRRSVACYAPAVAARSRRMLSNVDLPPAGRTEQAETRRR